MSRSAFLLLVALAGCASPPPDPPAGCNPLVADDCATPFPSSFYETADASSPTGVRVAIAATVMPSSASGAQFRAAQLIGRDGFSPATPFVVYFKAGVDGSSLPGDANPDASLSPSSPVQIIDYATGERVPLMAELDAGALPGDRQALLIHPLVRLDNAKRYVIALVNLKSASGKDLTPRPFRALRDKTPLSKSLSPLRSRYDEIFAALAAAGVARSSLTLAWDVIIASEGSATSHLLTMRDQALALADAGMLGYAITSTTDSPNDANLLREIVGTLTVPSFLTDDSLGATLATDGSGAPVLRGMGTADFVVHVPQCAKTATAPLPVIVFGHGLLGAALSELNSDYQKQVGNQLCMIQIGTDWIGLSSHDVPTITANVIGDLNHFDIITDRLQQAHVNIQVLTRLFLRSMKNDPALQLAGRALTDGSQIYYYGISDGGIQGATFMALTKDVTRGVLNVPGCEFSLMMFRSHDFASLKDLLNTTYQDPLDQQLLITMSQSYWDYTDPITWSPHLLQNPLPSTPTKKILVQEAIADAQVPNLATRILARTIGLPGMDLEQPVWGVTQQPPPLDSAYTQWDVRATPVPADQDVPPPTDNSAHQAIRALPALVQQLQAFFKPDGQVVQTCSGPCVFN